MLRNRHVKSQLEFEGMIRKFLIFISNKRKKKVFDEID